MNHIALALAQAESDWHVNVGEHDRKPGSRIDQMFIASGWNRFGVPKGAHDKIPDWCGMAVCSWLLAAGMNPGLNTSFLHTFNVEAFFTYGKQKNVNPGRLDRVVTLPTGDMDIAAWHKADRQPRRWTDRGGIASAVGSASSAPSVFAPGDVLLIDWAGANDADHIAMVRHWDPTTKILMCIEGNRTGKGPDGKTRRDAVVVCTYDLSKPAVLRQLYGVGRLSPLDFTTHPVRPK